MVLLVEVLELQAAEQVDLDQQLHLVEDLQEQLKHLFPYYLILDTQLLLAQVALQWPQTLIYKEITEAALYLQALHLLEAAVALLKVEQKQVRVVVQAVAVEL